MNDTIEEVRTGYIYGLFDSRLPLHLWECRYIGKTITQPKARLRDHVRSARIKTTHRARWMKSVEDGGGTVIQVIFETCEGVDRDAVNATLLEREVTWIASGRAQAWNLTNATDGGEGLTGYKHTEENRQKMREREVTAETRAKLSAARKGKPLEPEHAAKIADILRVRNAEPKSDEYLAAMSAAQTGKVRSEESKRKQSEALKGHTYLLGYKQSPEHAQKSRTNAIGSKRTPEQLAAMSERSMGNVGRTGQSLTDEHRANLSVALTGHEVTQETKDKIAESKRGSKHTEETRRKMSESHKARNQRRREEKEQAANDDG